jgi:PAS domain S-box-containing protein
LSLNATQRIASIVESSADAIVSKHLNGVITSWDYGAERIFGYTAEEVIGKPITILLPPDRYNEEPSFLERIRRGERIEHYETVRTRKDGSRVDISLTISPVKPKAKSSAPQKSRAILPSANMPRNQRKFLQRCALLCSAGYQVDLNYFFT